MAAQRPLALVEEGAGGRVRLTLDGKPYFELEIRTLRVMDRLDEPLLAGPR